MKEQGTQHEHYLRLHKDEEDITRLAEKLAPPEEIEVKTVSGQSVREDDGTLVVDTGALRLPQGFAEDEKEKRGIFGLEPVIVFILTLLIAFIVLIAYLVYRMPAPVK